MNLLHFSLPSEDLIYQTNSEVEIEVGQSLLVSDSHLEPTTRCLFSVWQLRVSLWICNPLVQLLLDLTRAVTLGSKSCRNHDHILLSQLRLHQPGGPGPRIYIPQDTITTAPWYVSNYTLHNDLQIPFITEEIKRYLTLYYNRLIGHENSYVTELDAD
jgi:hypothetical protein